MNQFTEQTKSEIYKRLDELTPETKGQWGSMNVTQMLTHMNDAFRISLGMKETKDKSNFFWNKILFPVSIYWMGFFPKNADAPVEINQQKEGSKPRDFYTELEFLKKMMDIFNEREEEKLKPHPLFGKLSKKQWRDLFVVHFNHHLKQFGV
jgi:hypothetical protein